tara:strand:+ start:33 stop:359 length:327 start_codon:yes stop_codon:yes gene_type:complete
VSSLAVTNEELREFISRVQNLLWSAEQDGCECPQVVTARKVLIPLSVKLHQPPPPKPEPVKQLTQLDIAKQSGFTGDICVNQQCQSMSMVRNGTCLKCMDCGTENGCS